MRQEVISKSCLILLLLFSAGLLAQAPPAAESKKPDYSQEASVIESLSRKVEFQNDGTGYTETTLRARIQSDAGVKQFGLLIFQYQQANDTPEITYVRVRKPDGTTVVTPAENIQDLPADVTREAPFYSDVRQKHVAVRGLSVGDTLEYQIRNRTHTPIVPGHFWLAHDFSRSGIVLEETLEVNVPAARTDCKDQVCGNATLRDGRRWPAHLPMEDSEPGTQERGRIKGRAGRGATGSPIHHLSEL
jgi:hypothetical protein